MCWNVTTSYPTTCDLRPVWFDAQRELGRGRAAEDTCVVACVSSGISKAFRLWEIHPYRASIDSPGSAVEICIEAYLFSLESGRPLWEGGDNQRQLVKIKITSATWSTSHTGCLQGEFNEIVRRGSNVPRRLLNHKSLLTQCHNKRNNHITAATQFSLLALFLRREDALDGGMLDTLTKSRGTHTRGPRTHVWAVCARRWDKVTLCDLWPCLTNTRPTDRLNPAPCLRLSPPRLAGTRTSARRPPRTAFHLYFKI